MLGLSSRLQPLRRSGRQTRLDFYPQDLTLVEVIQVILIFVARQLLSLLGLDNKFGIKANVDGETKYVLPDLRLSMPLRITDDKIQEYALAVGQKDPRQILKRPEQLCVMLAAFSEPAFLLLLAHHQSPIRPIGSVNVRNRFELLRPDLIVKDDRFHNGRAGKEARARFIPETRNVKRGLELDLEVDIVDLEDETVVFRQVFTTLQFMKVKGKLEEAVNTSASDDKEWSGEVMEILSIPRDFTMRWASICKDYNPIHTSSLAARVLGLPGRILHGNHALAWAFQSLQGHFTLASDQPQRVTVDVQFRRPMVVPAKLVLEFNQPIRNHNILRLRSDSGKTYVTSSVTAGAL